MREQSSETRPWALIVLSAGLVLFSSATAALRLQDWPYIWANLGLVLFLLWLAKRSGLTSSEVGFSRASVGAGLLAGGIGLGALLIGLVIATSLDGASIPESSSVGCGERVSDAGELMFQVFLRVGIGTAFAEEVVFRGVLLALWSKRWGPGCNATMATTLPFALWHIVPTIVNQARCSADLLGTVAVALVGTFTAGIILVWLRRRTRGILGPVLLHAIVNGGLIAASYMLSS